MKDLVLPDFDNLKNLSVAETRDLISVIEEALKERGEKIDVHMEHHFSDAVYAREMNLPAGVLIVGKIHKKENLNILSKGEVLVLSVEGVIRVKAPHTFVSKAGTKRVIYAHTDVTWTTIHGTELRDLDEIESEFIAKNYDGLQIEAGEQLWLGL